MLFTAELPSTLMSIQFSQVFFTNFIPPLTVRFRLFDSSPLPALQENCVSK